MFVSVLCLIMGTVAVTNSEKFLGCYLDVDNNTPIVNTARQLDSCLSSCRERYNSYALLYVNECSCSNQLGSIFSSEFCRTACHNCKEFEQLRDVYETTLHYTQFSADTANSLGPPRNLQVNKVTDNSAEILWRSPDTFSNILKYIVEAQVIHTFANSLLPTPILEYSNNTFKVELNLHSGTKYNVSVRAVSKNGEGIPAIVIVETQIGIPDNIPSTPKIISQEHNLMNVQITPVVNNNGPISAYRLIVINEEKNQALQFINLMSYMDAIKLGLFYYIAADLKPEEIDKPFTVGDGKYYGNYYNAPLKSNVKYRLMVGVVSIYNGKTETAYSNHTALLHGFIDMTTETYFYYEHPLQNAIDNINIIHQDENESSTLIIILSIGIAFVSLLLIVGLIGFYILTRRLPNRRRRLNDTQELTIQGPILEIENSGFIPEEEIVPINHYQNLKQKVWTIPQTLIKLESSNLLGTGKYGRVNSGTVLKENSFEPVAIYSINDRRLSKENKTAMLKDLDVLIRTDKHSNILTLIGTCETADIVLIVLEYASMNLKDVLLGSRDALPGRFCNMQEIQALNIALGVAKGMEHLSSLNIIHKQLCTRNISITHGLTPKISGYGLMQYYNPNRTPDYTRWTASEVLKHNQYLIKSDVWSFACLLWEICTLGGTPYSTVSNNEITDKVINGLRLPNLHYISDELYQLMLNCWQMDWDERPTFDDLIDSLREILADEDIPHLRFDLYQGFQYEEFYPDMELAARTVYS